MGGNLRAIGHKPGWQRAWTGGVENPWNSSEVYTNGSSTVAAVKMSDLSLVTSGDYQRYFHMLWTVCATTTLIDRPPSGPPPTLTA